MSRSAPITSDQLTNALRALDVNFIIGGQNKGESLHKRPARLIAALAESDESRLRLSSFHSFLSIPILPGMYAPLLRNSDQRRGSYYNVITVQPSGSHKNIRFAKGFFPITFPMK